MARTSIMLEAGIGLMALPIKAADAADHKD
jgi:hypothetical protein